MAATADAHHYDEAEALAAVAASIEEDGATIAAIAKRIGVSRLTVYRWMDAHPPLKAAIDDARGTANDIVRRSVFVAARGGFLVSRTTRTQKDGTVIEAEKYAPPDMTAAQFWLCNRASDEWRHASRIEVDANISHVVRIVDDV